MDDSDLYGLSFDDEGTAAEKAQALATALLRTKQLGNTDTLIGGQLAGLGNQEAQQYNQGQQSLLKAGENRLLRNTEATRNAALAQYHNDTISQRQLEEDRKRAKDEQGSFSTSLSGDTAATTDKKTGEVTFTKTGAKKLVGVGGMGSAAPATPEDEERMDFFARQYNLMGVDGLPPAARGKAGIALAARIQNRAHTLDPTASPGMAHVSLQANKADLAEATKQASTMDVNDEKAHADIASLRATMKPLVNTGSPWINKTFHELQENAGNADVAGYLGAMVVARAQINKVINSSTLTESARQEANEMLKDSATPAQTERVLGIIEQDMARSKDAMHKRVSNAQDRISGKKPPAEAAPSAAPAAKPVDPAARVRARLLELDPDHKADPKALKEKLISEGLLTPDGKVALR